MSSEYSFISNSSVIFIVCAIAIIGVLTQSVIFMKIAWRRGTELGIDKSLMKDTIKNSAIFSILPSLPILISYMILVPALGKFFPWLRLSVIGSASYETMAADMAAQAYGYEGISTAVFTPDVYVCITWTVTLGILLSCLSSLLIKGFDKKIRSVDKEKNKFMKVAVNAMFLGLLGSMASPYLVDFNNVTGIFTLLVAGLAAVLFSKVSTKYKVLKEFSFSLSMIVGMAFASFYTVLIG